MATKMLFPTLSVCPPSPSGLLGKKQANPVAHGNRARRVGESCWCSRAAGLLASMQRRPPGYRQADSSKTNAERKALHKNAVYKAMQPKGIVQRAHTESSSRRTTTGSSSSVTGKIFVPRYDGSSAVGLALKSKGEHRSEREIELLAVFMNQVPLLHQLGGLVLRRLCTLASCVLFEDGEVDF